MFADDLLLFLEAVEDQASLVNSILSVFFSMSGFKISQDKTYIFFFSKNVTVELRQALASTMGFSVTTTLGKYLGVPVLHSRVTNHTYANILDKADARLADWKADTLSLAGHPILTESVVSSLLSYTMQTSWLPNAICDRLEKRCRNFLWGDNSINRKIHLVSWDKVCQPKGRSNIGIKRQREMNIVLLTKLSWSMLTKPTSLWVRLLLAKHKLTPDLMMADYVFPKGSTFLRAMSRVWKFVRSGVRWSVGDGTTACFWRDNWTNNPQPLLRDMLGPVLISQLDWTVSDYVTTSGQW
ncbi:Unknown protein [Striga hermonthica]|uniref:Reverse transcriptase domain-containing protein n=1 Tax=Striga hermonthica TaxID=68872 RepID=A0A9N7RHS4_STRHE|nr:Unknown protein [Striga hermonthica]